MIGAGAVVTKDVQAHELMIRNWKRQRGSVSVEKIWIKI